MIVSWTQLFVAPEPYEHDVPYVLAVVALDTSKRILCAMADVREDLLVVGARVQLVMRVIHAPGTNTIIAYGYKAIMVDNNDLTTLYPRVVR